MSLPANNFFADRTSYCFILLTTFHYDDKDDGVRDDVNGID